MAMSFLLEVFLVEEVLLAFELGISHRLDAITIDAELLALLDEFEARHDQTLFLG
jgi:hypothetical protein